MRTRVMKKRGRKITAILLAFAMVLPMAWSQTVVTEAAGTDSDYLTLAPKNNKAQVPMELGDEITLELKAKSAFQAASIGGTFSFKEKVKENGSDVVNTVSDCFTVQDVTTLKNWGWGYDGDNGEFSVYTTNTSVTPFQNNEVIATITLKVVKAVDNVDIVYTLNSFNAKDSTTNVYYNEGEDGKTVTCATMTNSQLPRKVAFEMDTDTIARVGNYSKNKPIEIPVRIGANNGFTSVTMKFEYDTSLMTYQGYEMSAKTRNYFIARTVKNDTSNGEVSLAFAGKKDATYTGEFIVLKFLPDPTSIGSTYSLKGSVSKMYNESKKSVAADDFTTTINFVEGYQLGDVDMNGSINLLDVTLTLQKYNEVRELTDEQKELADVNRDGAVTLVDALLILKYVNKEIIAF